MDLKDINNLQKSKNQYSKVLAETEWLEENLDDPDLKIIEINPAPLPPNTQGHIPKSIILDWKMDLWHPTIRDFITERNFEKLMEKSGITNDSQVIFSSLVLQFASYAFFTFHYNGHKNLKILNGGLQKWIAERRPITKQLSSPEKSKYKSSKSNNSIRVHRDYVLNNLRKKDVILLDARTPEEYKGELINVPELPQEGSYRAGRIPGAIHIYYEENIQRDCSFKPLNELKKMYLSNGITPDKEIITYCRTGHRATLVWFVLTRLLEYSNVKVYDGSWTEWGNLVNAPIEK
jgi:thiosulfate/3-mercaptopyruvate sulfurtransferase